MNPRPPRAVPLDAPFSEMILGRLDLLRDLRGESCLAVSLRMRDPETGATRAHNTFGRMVHPGSKGDARSPRLAQVDEVLAAMGLPVEVLFSPILSERDVEIMRWLADGKKSRRSRTRTTATFPNADGSLQRLALQELVNTTDRWVALTDAGLSCVRGLPPTEEQEDAADLADADAARVEQGAVLLTPQDAALDTGDDDEDEDDEG